ncbi:hypothetical protein OIC43_03510 [Streptomyces sp. NBC_00825]|uniref:hypothetical protein n=1 Tax=unclassified Streptomyces TaxID=2593676 RepID=UPI002ED387D0|nr:hypothetical protein OG832_40205 [Streptomyces sp. NBC_00826]WTH88198.1 hypothetical protein OIC43_03510 [Streptomyces sp. NBC_00825]WTH96926.1 hypothetical protein OHA23_03510 [Streptomyces sp. NBC_00822]
METWTRLAAVHGLLEDVQEQLRIAEDGIVGCPAELTDPRHHKWVNVLPTRELLSNVLGAPAPANGDQEVNRQRAARNSSPSAAAHSKVPPVSTPEAASITPSPLTPRTR